VEQRFSIRHDGGRAQIDHILASAPLVARLRAARFFNDELREHAPLPSDGRSQASPGPGQDVEESQASPAGATEAAPTVDSDHAPFVARFE
jgi:exonuclease III